MNDETSPTMSEPRPLTWEEQTRVPYDGPVTCRCCGKSEQFGTPEAAHKANWDVAPFFSVQPFCDRCFVSLWMQGKCQPRHDQQDDDE